MRPLSVVLTAILQSALGLLIHRVVDGFTDQMYRR